MISHLKFFISTPEVRTIGVGFGLHSLIFGNWITRIPDIKSLLGISDTELGTALLFAPIGAIAVLPWIGVITRKFGLGKVTLVSSVLALLSLVLLAYATSFWFLSIGLFYFGFTNALMGTSINMII